jgi:hypothetical protein
MFVLGTFAAVSIHAKGKNVTIDKKGQMTTIECTGNAVTVTSDDNMITLKGECSKLTVKGMDNNITAASILCGATASAERRPGFPRRKATTSTLSIQGSRLPLLARSGAEYTRKHREAFEKGIRRAAVVSMNRQPRLLILVSQLAKKRSNLEQHIRLIGDEDVVISADHPSHSCRW